jgi:hypothetical protein
MQNFKQYLKESKLEFAPWCLYGSELQNYLDNNYHGDIPSINKNGTVTFKGSRVFIENKNLQVGRIPFQIQGAKSILVRADDITSVWGMPMKCSHMSITSSKLKTLDHLNSTVKEEIRLETPSLEKFDCNVKAYNIRIVSIIISSLSGFNKYFELDGGSLVFDSHLHSVIKSNLLSLILLKGVKDIIVAEEGMTIVGDTDFSRAIKIIKKHVLSDKDVLECQEELIENGYKEYAKL